VSVVLEVTGAFCGLLGSLLLIVSAWRSAPFRRTIDLVGKLETTALLATEAKEDAEAANRQLGEVMRLEPAFIVAGAVFLSLGFGLSLAKHLF
jgi:hypothetical protein